MKKLLCVVFACVATALAVLNAEAQEGVGGTTVRQAKDKAKVEGCKIAKPGDYKITVGDVIELDYTYLAGVVPSVTPKKVDYKLGLLGPIGPSPLGVRSVRTPGMVGTGTIAFYFDARSEGDDSVTLLIDGQEYGW